MRDGVHDGVTQDAYMIMFHVDRCPPDFATWEPRYVLEHVGLLYRRVSMTNAQKTASSRGSCAAIRASTLPARAEAPLRPHYTDT